MSAARRNVFALQGYYGAGNFGDDWLLAATIAGIRERAPGARFIVRDHGDAVAAPGMTDVAFSHSEHILAGQSLGRAQRLLRYARTAWRQFGEAGWLVFGGGTQFHSHGGNASLLLNALLCLLARMRGARVAALGVGVGRIEGTLGRLALSFIVRASAVFVVRDKVSHDAAGPRALLAADLAFSRPVAARTIHGDAVAFTVYPPAWSPTVQAAMAEAGTGRIVVLLTVQRRGATEGDARTIAALRDALPHTVSYSLRTLTADAEAFAGVGVVCGMRFHALLAAAQAGLPFVGIAHDAKITDLCTRMRMPCLSPNGLTGEALRTALAEAATRTPDPAALAACRAEAEANFAALPPLLR